jgi:hypothetical protein
MARISSPDARFKFYTKKTKKCWIWVGGHTQRGRPQIRVGGSKKQVYAHRWTYERFLGPIPEGLYVCHKCDNPSCVRPSHLFLGTQDDNMKDMVSKGRQNRPKGESNGRAVLTEKQVLYIRRVYRKGRGKYGGCGLARRFGINAVTIRNIILRKLWKHLN